MGTARSALAPPHTRTSRWKLPCGSFQPNSFNQLRQEGRTKGTTSRSGPGCDPLHLSEEAPVALETHLSGRCWQRCWTRRGASESRTAGDGPPPGGHHRDAGKEHPALPGPGHGGPGFPGHGRLGAGSARSPLPVCLSVSLLQWSPAPKCLDLVSSAWLSYLLP